MKIIYALHGIGDSIYQRPLVKMIAEREDQTYIVTPLPHFYDGIPNLQFLRTQSPWRTQAKELSKTTDIEWATALPESAYNPLMIPPIRPFYPKPNVQRMVRVIKPELEIKFGYTGEAYSQSNIIQCLEKIGKVTLPDQIEFDMPSFGDCPVDTHGKKLALVRPPTDRAEWLTSSRQCDPQYTNKAALMLRDAGYFTVSIADTEEKKEWLVGDAPDVDLSLNHGELSIYQLMALSAHADIIVGGVGWIFPAGIAFKRNLFMIFGGRLGYDHLQRISDYRMDLSRLGYAEPEYPCMCTEPRHNCNKTIVNFESKFASYLNKIHQQDMRRSDAGRIEATTGRIN